MMERILLDNRYGDKNYLEFIEKTNDLYKFKIKWDANASSFMRVLYNDDSSINAIDPSGGPYLHQGYQLKFQDKDLEVVEIYHGESLWFVNCKESAKN